MSRSPAKPGNPAGTPVPADPALLGVELSSWAAPVASRGGRRDALLGRVEALHLSLDGRAIEARVRGDGGSPERPTAWVDDGGAVRSRCTCGAVDGEPCRHAVAALEALRFPRRAPPSEARRRVTGRPGAGRGRILQTAPAPAGFVPVGDVERMPTRDERIAAARAEELALRRHRGRRRRLTVAPLPGDGPLVYEVSGASQVPMHTVTLRGPGGALGSCDCADFADNELLTCEHLEKVRSWRSRRRKADRGEVPADLVSLWWSPRAWIDEVPERLREIRIDGPADRLPERARSAFDERGWLRPPDGGAKSAVWVREAIERTGTAARDAGLGFELDPAILAHVVAAEESHARERRLARATIDGSPAREILDGLAVRPHPYQEHGTIFLARRGRAFLADDMGLGKTLQAIAAALVLRRTAGARRALVVCPASLKHQWSREIERVCGEGAPVVEGPRAGRLELYRTWVEGFLVVNYEIVLRDLDELRTAADLVILDEAQRIKNWDTKTARAVKRLESPYAFILTGTPLENRLPELHSLVEFLHPRALGPRWRLLPLHAVVDGQGRVLAYEGLDLLRRRLAGFFLRRERDAVLDQLPERTDNTYWTGMTADQRRPYRKQAATAAALLSRKASLGTADVRVLLQALTNMRILCNAHAQHDWERWGERLADPRPPDRAELRELGSPKLEEFARVLEDLLEDSADRVVVFSQWERMLRLAEFAGREVLERLGATSGLFHGGLTSRARARLLERFRTDPAFRVLFSTDAGGLGLNLQDAASIVVNLEVPWNPAVLEQRIGRVHRIGQRKGVRVLHFVTRQAIEERVRHVVEAKRALFEGLLVDEVDRVILDDRVRSSFFDRVRELVG